MRRIILHSDMNAFYASVECLYRPELREVPMAVGGDAEARHGIILAKNDKAKAFGVQTAEQLWQARQKCPELVIVPAHPERYRAFSLAARQIYLDYTSQVEPFGPDEAWLDVTGSAWLFGGTGQTLAEDLRARIKRELGLTVSIGVSYNKVLAKLGSDYKKPDAVTVFSPENLQEKVWPLPVRDLLYVGAATERRLADLGIHTIGQLACADPKLLRYHLGKNGVMLWGYARGMDETPVAEYDHRRTVQSIGNSRTPPRDLQNDDDVRVVFWTLCDSVATRLREHGFYAGALAISVRDNALESFTRQMVLPTPTNLSRELLETAMKLFRANYRWGRPVRSVGVQACDLRRGCDTAFQLDLTGTEARREKLERLEKSVFGLRKKYGNLAVQAAARLSMPELGQADVGEGVLQPFHHTT